MNQNEKISHIIETLNEATTLIANNKGENINNIDKDLALGKIRMAYDFILKLETKEVSTIKVEVPKKEVQKEIVIAPVEEKKVVEIIEEVKIEIPVEKTPEIIIEEPIKIEEKPIIAEEKKIEVVEPTLFNVETIIPETTVEQITKEKTTEPKTTITSNSKTIADHYQTTKSKTISDSLTKNEKDFSTSQQLKPIKNIKSAISINDRVMFSRDLFENNAALYNESIDKINEMTNIDDAMEFINKTIKFKEDSESHSKFLELVYRRFA
jgi:hypothetical protein